MVERLLTKYDDFFQRVFEIIPGLLIWVILLSPIWAGLSIPMIIINALVVLTVYWLYRAVLLALGLFVGYYHYRKDITQDWLKNCMELKREELYDPEILPKNELLPKHLIVIAHYGESYEVLHKSLKALTEQNYPKELVYLSVSIEQRKAEKDPEYADRYNQLKKDFGDYFEDRLFVYVHPKDLPGEIIGAGSNRRWGAVNAVTDIEKMGLDPAEFLITAPDGDIVFHKEYLAAVSYKWLVNDKRNNKFYQTAVYTFNNNYWDVPILVRILSTGLTLPILSSSIFEKHRRETYSCYSLNLGLMKAVGYWDPSLEIDDTTFYWKPYMYLNGEWFCEVFFIPLSADAIYNPSYIQNHRDQYRQYLRWGWGVISFPIGIKSLLLNKKISLFEKIAKTIHLFEVFVLWKVLGFLLTFGVPIIFFVNNSLEDKVISHTIPETISNILTFAVIFLVPSTYFKMKLTPPRPEGMSKLKYIFLFLLEIPLNIVVLLTFSTLPFIEATTRMMIGRQRNRQLITGTWTNKTLAK